MICPVVSIASISNAIVVIPTHGIVELHADHVRGVQVATITPVIYHSRSAALFICCCFLDDPLSNDSLCQHMQATGSKSENSCFSVQSPLPPTLHLVQEFINTKHVCRILLELHRTFPYLLLSGTLKPYLCLSQSEPIIIQYMTNALQVLSATSKVFLIPFINIAVGLIYSCCSQRTMEEGLVIQIVRFFICK